MKTDDPFAELLAACDETVLNSLRGWLGAHLPNHPEASRERLVTAALAPFKAESLTAIPGNNAKQLVIMKYFDGTSKSQDDFITRLALDHLSALNTRTVRGKAISAERAEILKTLGPVNEKLCAMLYLMVCAAEKLEKESAT